jgi:hypothetical protein
MLSVFRRDVIDFKMRSCIFMLLVLNPTDMQRKQRQSYTTGLELTKTESSASVNSAWVSEL